MIGGMDTSNLDATPPSFDTGGSDGDERDVGPYGVSPEVTDTTGKEQVTKDFGDTMLQAPAQTEGMSTDSNNNDDTFGAADEY